MMIGSESAVNWKLPVCKLKRSCKGHVSSDIGKGSLFPLPESGILANPTLLCSGLSDPERKSANLAQVVHNLGRLFPDTALKISGEPLEIDVDVLQLEQTLINLVKNAIEASVEGAEIELCWQTSGDMVQLKVIDNGSGMQNSDNLFTPYYTTKPTGSGVGLVFCQQVVEAHGGFITVANRLNAQGCEVTISLPIRAALNT